MKIYHMSVQYMTNINSQCTRKELPEKKCLTAIPFMSSQKTPGFAKTCRFHRCIRHSLYNGTVINYQNMKFFCPEVKCHKTMKASCTFLCMSPSHRHERMSIMSACISTSIASSSVLLVIAFVRIAVKWVQSFPKRLLQVVSLIKNVKQEHSGIAICIELQMSNGFKAKLSGHRTHFL